MTTNNNGTVDIAVDVNLTDENDKKVLSFIVQDECHLKKLAIGAYAINVIDSNKILNKLLNDNDHVLNKIVACGEFLIACNENESNGINAILFNKSCVTLKKGVCIFKIHYKKATSTVTEGTITTDDDDDEDDDDDDADYENNYEQFEKEELKQNSDQDATIVSESAAGRGSGGDVDGHDYDDGQPQSKRRKSSETQQ
ncbi:telokin-like protein-20 [Spodoptera litura nucleopolyhedrovirus]|uniref:Telokin-like protein-20 n=1 Tax=Spodoptera litura multicapsid nucleopolyhedrovirus TaxID=46242 RepID=Q91BE7_NPVST|nr:telokin-like protein-20 [Spodoptera litura nucleopolyhedrovirus]AAL01760.1 telokin-like protein-20 [Spodoptera litura nucleopolyhedrovirus]QHN73927.1 tlp-20 [Spodoptera litura nucleopolyhedrovirus]WML75143.1 telokin-like protein-20 [Spodoptera littoralis nucleopolyhedrovirus]